MLDKGKELDWFDSNADRHAGGRRGGRASLFFLAWELTEEHPVVDLRLFARRNFRSATVALSVAYGVFFGNVVLLPLWLQQYMGYTATGPAWRWRRSACSRSCCRRGSARTSAASIRAGWRRSRSSASRWCCGCARTSTPQADFATILIPTILQGAAMAFFFIPLLTHHVLGPAARAHAGGRRPVELRAHHRRRVRHVDLHDAVGEPRDAAPRAPGRGDQPRQRRGDADARASSAPPATAASRRSRSSTG